MIRFLAISDPAYFNEFSKLPSALVTTTDALENGDEQKWFDWDGFHTAINGYKGDDLTFDKFKSNKINQSTATVSTMVDKIVTFMRDALSVVLLDKDVTALKANIEATFTNLKEAKDKGWADFSKSSSAENSSWEYRVLFAFPNPDLEDFFYSLVTTIKLEADITEESSWWGLTSSTSRNFSSAIDAMELVVMKGFRDPSE
ncbi:delta-endotoxin CytB [Gloeophyllum trabeum ATCC 11539]|uniref:Delta-endotoxin CytB n=1 Tax=Gloeophyllum trabeum (strain ATCC 11539 / FP-39264 / Madison 617) TaxID=670483 RepID=S7Q5Q4_GLOTA|nr:delta-endotoxin CytB [Gloeophyllum trabeum ATCC 11539]EPQ55391.1 delta-endotoxin CytB [Gloeophyllum trabeum ATCC 11539]